MNRRQFMKVSGSVIIGSTLLPQTGLSMKGGSALKAIDVQYYLRSLCDVSEPSCDRFIIGDFYQLFYRLDGAGLIIGQHDGGEHGIWFDSLFEILGAYHPGFIY